jgi:hypothetical protein
VWRAAPRGAAQSALAIARDPTASRASTSGSAHSSGPISCSAAGYRRSIALDAGRRISRSVAGAPAAAIARRTCSIRGAGSTGSSSARGGVRRRSASATGGAIGVERSMRRRTFG